MKLKQILCMSVAVVLAAAALSSCGKEETQPPSTGTSSSSTVGGVSATGTPDRPANDDQVQTRDEKQQYEYAEEDFALVDTETQKQISIGMSMLDIEAVTGEALNVDRSYKIYNGIIVKYADEIATAFIVANGNMTDDMNPGKYATTRGVTLDTTVDAFQKAYGNAASSVTPNPEATPAEGEEAQPENTAKGVTRYLQKDGDKINYIGTDLTKENRPADTSTLYMQDFLFNTDTGRIDSIRIGTYDGIMGA